MKKLKLIFIIIGVVALIAVAKYFNIQQYLKEALDWVNGLGAIAGVVFVLIYIVCTVFLIPGSALTLGAGALFGVVRGTLYVMGGSVLGATAAFLVGRYFARDWISKKIQGNKKFSAIDEAVGKEGWKIVGLTRLSPVFPFTLLNYAYGLTQVSLRDYFFASWIGMIPGTIMYVYLGTAAGEGLKAAGGGGGKSPQEYALLGVGLLATIVVTVFVTKIAKKALREKVSGA